MNARTQLFELSMEGRQVDEAVASIFTVFFSIEVLVNLNTSKKVVIQWVLWDTKMLTVILLILLMSVVHLCIWIKL